MLLTRVCFGVRRYLGILLYDPIVSAAPVLCNGLFNPQAGNATDGERWKGRRGKKYRRKALFIGNVRKGRGGAGAQRGVSEKGKTRVEMLRRVKTSPNKWLVRAERAGTKQHRAE